jgi:hypothetical protein
MSQAAVHRQQGRFDASVLPGAKPACGLICPGSTSWTSDGLIRQASFKEMWEDKSAKSVIIETAASPPNP